MMLEAEAGLMALAVGLYLYDSALLLYFNEGIVAPKGRGRWAVSFGSSLQLRGRELFLPPPWTPHRPLFRLAWSLEEPGTAAETGWTERRALFRPLAPMVLGMALAVFVLLPLGLFSRLGERMLLLAVLLLYANIVVALLWFALKRSAFGLTRRRLAALAVEALLCSPFALNLVRKVSSEMPVGEELDHAARRLQAPEDWRESRARLIARIDEELGAEDEASARGAALRARRASLESLDGKALAA